MRGKARCFHLRLKRLVEELPGCLMGIKINPLCDWNTPLAYGEAGLQDTVACQVSEPQYHLKRLGIDFEQCFKGRKQY